MDRDFLAGVLDAMLGRPNRELDVEAEPTPVPVPTPAPQQEQEPTPIGLRGTPQLGRSDPKDVRPTQTTLIQSPSPAPQMPGKKPPAQIADAGPGGILFDPRTTQPTVTPHSPAPFPPMVARKAAVPDASTAVVANGQIVGTKPPLPTVTPHTPLDVSPPAPPEPVTVGSMMGAPEAEPEKVSPPLPVEMQQPARPDEITAEDAEAISEAETQVEQVRDEVAAEVADTPGEKGQLRYQPLPENPAEWTDAHLEALPPMVVSDHGDDILWLAEIVAKGRNGEALTEAERTAYQSMGPETVARINDAIMRANMVPAGAEEEAVLDQMGIGRESPAGTVLGLVGGVFDAGLNANHTNMGEGLYNHIVHGEGIDFLSLSGAGIALQELLENPIDTAVDSIVPTRDGDAGSFITWGQENPDLVQQLYEEGWDYDGDGEADYTGGRAVWEGYVNDQPWHERSMGDLGGDPFNIGFGLVRVGTRATGGTLARVLGVLADSKRLENAPVIQLIDNVVTPEKVYTAQSRIISATEAIENTIDAPFTFVLKRTPYTGAVAQWIFDAVVPGRQTQRLPEYVEGYVEWFQRTWGQLHPHLQATKTTEQMASAKDKEKVAKAELEEMDASGGVHGGWSKAAGRWAPPPGATATGTTTTASPGGTPAWMGGGGTWSWGKPSGVTPKPKAASGTTPAPSDLDDEIDSLEAFPPEVVAGTEPAGPELGPAVRAVDPAPGQQPLPIEERPTATTGPALASSISTHPDDIPVKGTTLPRTQLPDAGDPGYHVMELELTDGRRVRAMDHPGVPPQLLDADGTPMTGPDGAPLYETDPARIEAYHRERVRETLNAGPVLPDDYDPKNPRDFWRSHGVEGETRMGEYTRNIAPMMPEVAQRFYRTLRQKLEAIPRTQANDMSVTGALVRNLVAWEEAFAEVHQGPAAARMPRHVRRNTGESAELPVDDPSRHTREVIEDAVVTEDWARAAADLRWLAENLTPEKMRAEKITDVANVPQLIEELATLRIRRLAVGQLDPPPPGFLENLPGMGDAVKNLLAGDIVMAVTNPAAKPPDVTVLNALSQLVPGHILMEELQRAGVLVDAGDVRFRRRSDLIPPDMTLDDRPRTPLDEDRLRIYLNAAGWDDEAVADMLSTGDLSVHAYTALQYGARNLAAAVGDRPAPIESPAPSTTPGNVQPDVPAVPSARVVESHRPSPAQKPAEGETPLVGVTERPRGRRSARTVAVTPSGRRRNPWATPRSYGAVPQLRQRIDNAEVMRGEIPAQEFGTTRTWTKRGTGRAFEQREATLGRLPSGGWQVRARIIHGHRHGDTPPTFMAQVSIRVEEASGHIEEILLKTTDWTHAGSVVKREAEREMWAGLHLANLLQSPHEAPGYLPRQWEDLVTQASNTQAPVEVAIRQREARLGRPLTQAERDRMHAWQALRDGEQLERGEFYDTGRGVSADEVSSDDLVDPNAGVYLDRYGNEQSMDAWALDQYHEQWRGEAEAEIRRRERAGEQLSDKQKQAIFEGYRPKTNREATAQTRAERSAISDELEQEIERNERRAQAERTIRPVVEAELADNERYQKLRDAAETAEGAELGEIERELDRLERSARRTVQREARQRIRDRRTLEAVLRDPQYSVARGLGRGFTKDELEALSREVRARLAPVLADRKRARHALRERLREKRIAYGRRWHGVQLEGGAANRSTVYNVGSSIKDKHLQRWGTGTDGKRRTLNYVGAIPQDTIKDRIKVSVPGWVDEHGVWHYDYLPRDIIGWRNELGPADAAKAYRDWLYSDRPEAVEALRKIRERLAGQPLLDDTYARPPGEAPDPDTPSSIGEVVWAAANPELAARVSAERAKIRAARAGQARPRAILAIGADDNSVEWDFNLGEAFIGLVDEMNGPDGSVLIHTGRTKMEREAARIAADLGIETKIITSDAADLGERTRELNERVVMELQNRQVGGAEPLVWSHFVDHADNSPAHTFAEKLARERPRHKAGGWEHRPHYGVREGTNLKELELLKERLIAEPETLLDELEPHEWALWEADMAAGYARDARDAGFQYMGDVSRMLDLEREAGHEELGNVLLHEITYWYDQDGEVHDLLDLAGTVSEDIPERALRTEWRHEEPDGAPTLRELAGGERVSTLRQRLWAMYARDDERGVWTVTKRVGATDAGERRAIRMGLRERGMDVAGQSMPSVIDAIEDLEGEIKQLFNILTIGRHGLPVATREQMRAEAGADWVRATERFEQRSRQIWGSLSEEARAIYNDALRISMDEQTRPIPTDTRSLRERAHEGRPGTADEAMTRMLAQTMREVSAANAKVPYQPVGTALRSWAEQLARYYDKENFTPVVELIPLLLEPKPSDLARISRVRAVDVADDVASVVERLEPDDDLEAMISAVPDTPQGQPGRSEAELWRELQTRMQPSRKQEVAAWKRMLRGREGAFDPVTQKMVGGQVDSGATIAGRFAAEDVRKATTKPSGKTLEPATKGRAGYVDRRGQRVAPFLADADWKLLETEFVSNPLYQGRTYGNVWDELETTMHSDLARLTELHARVRRGEALDEADRAAKQALENRYGRFGVKIITRAREHELLRDGARAAGTVAKGLDPKAVDDLTYYFPEVSAHGVVKARFEEALVIEFMSGAKPNRFVRGYSKVISAWGRLKLLNPLAAPRFLLQNGIGDSGQMLVTGDVGTVARNVRDLVALPLAPLERAPGAVGRFGERINRENVYLTMYKDAGRLSAYLEGSSFNGFLQEWGYGHYMPHVQRQSATMSITEPGADELNPKASSIWTQVNGDPAPVASRLKKLARNPARGYMDGITRISTATEWARRISFTETMLRSRFALARREFITHAQVQANGHNGWPAISPDMIRGVLEEGDALSPVRAYRSLYKAAVASGLPPGRAVDYADRMARDWANIQRHQVDLTIEAMNRTLFSYEFTNADTLARYFFPFHFWATRALPFYMDAMLSNPMVLTGYLRATEGLEKENSDLPPGARAMVQLFGNEVTGLLLFMNPMAALGVIGLLDALDFEPEGETWLGAGMRHISSASGLMLYPWFQFLFNWSGQNGDSRFGLDPLGLARERAVFGRVLQYAASEGIVPNWLVELSGGEGGVLGAGYEAWLQRGRQAVTGLLPGVDTIWADDPQAGMKADMHVQAEAIYREREGLPADAVLSPKQYEEILFLLDNDPAFKDEVVERVSEDNVLAAMWNTLIPGTSLGSVVAPEQLEAHAAQQQGYAGTTEGRVSDPYADGVITAEEQQWLAQWKQEKGRAYEPGGIDAVNLQAGHAAELAGATPEHQRILQAKLEYSQLGNEEQRRVYRTWKTIAFGDEPLGYRISVGGRFYTQADLEAMTPDERRELAYLWVDEEPGRKRDFETIRALQQQSGYTIDSIDSAMPERHIFAWEEQVRATHPNLHHYREQVSEVNPNAARYFAAEKQEILSENPGISASDLMAKLDERTFTVEAYEAIHGIRTSIFDPDPLDTSKDGTGVADPAMWTEPASSATGASSAPGASEMVTPVELASMEQAYVNWLPQANLQLATMLNYPGFDLERMSPEGQQQALMMLGDSVPRGVEMVMAYRLWAVRQHNVGRDASHEAYIRTQLEGGPLYTTDPGWQGANPWYAEQLDRLNRRPQPVLAFPGNATTSLQPQWAPPAPIDLPGRR